MFGLQYKKAQKMSFPRTGGRRGVQHNQSVRDVVVPTVWGGAILAAARLVADADSLKRLGAPPPERFYKNSRALSF
jgi:hypothetical protein